MYNLLHIWFTSSLEPVWDFRAFRKMWMPTAVWLLIMCLNETRPAGQHSSEDQKKYIARLFHSYLKCLSVRFFVCFREWHSHRTRTNSISQVLFKLSCMSISVNGVHPSSRLWYNSNVQNQQKQITVEWHTSCGFPILRQSCTFEWCAFWLITSTMQWLIWIYAWTN